MLEPRLTHTTKAGRGVGVHYHVAYLNEEKGYGLIANNSGNRAHTHSIVYYPPQPPMIDPMTGMELMPAQPERWEIAPDPYDGHTHELTEYEPTLENPKEKDDDILRDVYELFRVAIETESDSKKEADEAEKFYCGEQWDATAKRELEGLDRAALTVNFVEKGIDTLVGTQIEQRTDMKVRPVEGGDQVVADIYTYALKQILEACDYQFKKTEVFKDAAIRGRGAFDAYVDFQENIFGDIKIDRFNPEGIYLGPHESPDCADLEYLIKTKWYSKQKLKQLWGEKAEDIEQGFYRCVEGISNEDIQARPDNYAVGSSNYMPTTTIAGEQVIDVSQKEMRVIECWRKVIVSANVVGNPDDNFWLNALGWSSKDIAAIKTLPGFIVSPRRYERIRITTVVGATVLSDENPADLATNDFHTIVVYAKKRGNRYWGKVKSVIDSQREVNRRVSQTVDVGNKCASYGWFIDSTTFPDSNAKEKFKRTATSPGFVQDVQDINRLPQKVEGVKFPAELVNLLQLGEERIVGLMNVVLEQGGANESAAHQLYRHKTKQTGNEYLFDAVKRAERKLGFMLIRLIQRYYDPERIYRLVQNSPNSQDMMVAGTSFVEWPQEEVVRALEDADVTKFDVVIDEAAWSPSVRMATFMLLSEMAQSGQQIPPDVILEFADIPEDVRMKINESIAMQNEQASSVQSQTAQMEIDKTLIGQGIIPPHIQEQYGLPAGLTPSAMAQPNPKSEAVESQRPKKKVIQIRNLPDGGKEAIIEEIAEELEAEQQAPVDEMMAQMQAGGGLPI